MASLTEAEGRHRAPPGRAILFDAGNTLVYADPERMAQIFTDAGWPAGGLQVQAAELSARRRLHEAIRDGQVGTEPEVWREYFASLFEGVGVPAGEMAEVGRRIRDVHAVDHLWTHVADGTEEALRALGAMGYRLAVISNADGRMEQLLERVGLRRHFEFVLDSGVMGVEKPDPAIFREGCRLLGLPPAGCLYVGDLYPVDYLGAIGAGLDAVLLDPMGLHEGRAPRVSTLGELPTFLA
ncbi:MAG TPA: HAD-IA family hydrolase [Longimicrobiales bacterium]|nr:HAD-IA family hydrolase [Longimicrobiales bacterium]